MMNNIFDINFCMYCNQRMNNIVDINVVIYGGIY